MVRYLVRQLINSLIVILLLVVGVFFIIRALPGDPVLALTGGHLSPEEIAQKRHDMGLDRPKIVQLFSYLKSLASFNLGTSLTDGRDVKQIILENGSVTLSLIVMALFFIAIMLSVIVPILYRKRNTKIDGTIIITSTVVYTIPVFVVGLMVQQLLNLTPLPSNGYASTDTLMLTPQHTHILLIDTLISGNIEGFFDIILHIIFPSMVLALVLLCPFIRLIRDFMEKIIKSDYVDAARARGIGWNRILKKYIMGNLLPVLLSFTGMQFALLIGGTVLTETTFNIQGLGSKLVFYVNNRDYDAIEGIVIYIGISVVLINTATNLINTLIDPRIKSSLLK